MENNLKCLFITLPHREKPDNFPPYGSMAVITALRRAGYKSTYLYNIDVLRPSKQEALDHINTFKPDILCISAPVSTAYENCKFFALETKRLLPDTIIVLGGNMAASAELLLKKASIDFCVLGEGERVCCQLFDKLTEGIPRSELCSIRGLAFLDGERLVNTGYADQLPRDRIFDVNWDILDEVSVRNYFPRIGSLDTRTAYHKYFFPYTDTGRPDALQPLDPDILNKTVGVISFSKGCVGRCTFCHRFISGIRIIPPELAIERIKELMRRFNVGALSISDECFGASEVWLKKFCELIKPLCVIWKVSGMRVDFVTPEIIEMMKEVGCRTIIYGTETGSERMLKVMEKRISLEKNYNAIKATVKAGLLAVPVLVVGMPGETPETIRETVEFIVYWNTIDQYQNPRDMSITFAQALPGTPLYEYARSVGKIGLSLDEEEKYLLTVSDRNAADEATTLNFTDYPRLLMIAWPILIQAIVNYRFVQRFGIKHFYKIIFHEERHPGFIDTLQKMQISKFFYFYPTFVYRTRHLLWLLGLAKIFKSHGAKYALKSLMELIGFFVCRLLSYRKRASFPYKSLRKILEEDVSNPYVGSEAMISLRKGR